MSNFDVEHSFSKYFLFLKILNTASLFHVVLLNMIVYTNFFDVLDIKNIVFVFHCIFLINQIHINYSPKLMISFVFIVSSENNCSYNIPRWSHIKNIYI